MSIRTVIKMGDPRLLLSAEPVTAFGTPQLTRLVEDLWETMKVHSGAGLAAPQIGENLQVVVFGTGEPNPRYPDAGIVPPTERSPQRLPASVMSASNCPLVR